MPRPPIHPVVQWKEVLEKAQSYQEWLASAEFEENAQAMEHNRKSIELSAEDKDRLSSLAGVVHVLAFAEDWCGDVVRHVPCLEKLADFSPKVVTYYMTRSDAPELFLRFLTNGGEAVPKFVFISQSFVECGNWGPMPSEYRDIIARGKACGDVPGARQIVSQRYKEDVSQRDVISELLQLLEIAATISIG